MPNDILLEQLYLHCPFLEAAKKYDTTTTSIRTNLYPHVEKVLETSKGKTDYKKCVANFMETRAQGLYDTLPCARIFFGEEDVSALFKALNFPKSVAADAILKTYYGEETNFSPKSAKDEFTITQLCVVRYFVMKNMTKEAELAMIHLAFSGKFYPSLHYRSYPILPVRHVMEYTINNVLSTKFDLISEGSVLGSIRKIGLTWLSSYKNRMKSFNDGDAIYMIQQLYSRIGSFMKNIATAYYKTYNEKDDLYIAYASDSLDDGDYHLADNDTLRVNKITEKTIDYINSTGVDYGVCKMCSDENITTNEIKSIIESLIGNHDNIREMKELISLMVVMYFANNPKSKNVTDVAFLTYSMAAKPNAKQREILRQKEIVEHFLADNSPAYLRRRSRIATRNSFEKAIRMYFALTIHNANR